MTPQRSESFHLADLLRKVFAIRANRQAEFDSLVEARTIDLLRRSDRLAPEQKRLLEEDLSAGRSLEIVGHVIRNPLRFELAICRSQALREIQKESEIAIEDGDQVSIPMLDHVVHEIIKRASDDLDVTEDDLSWYAVGESMKGLEATNRISRFIAGLHSDGLTDDLLAECWHDYPADAKTADLPMPMVEAASDWLTSERIARLAGMTIAAVRSKLTRLRNRRLLPDDSYERNEENGEFRYSVRVVQLVKSRPKKVKPKMKS
jgi:hypothetical protein